ncbi:hypothetical protein [Deinococcus sonorensis]|uniref:Uncharacterized protein n=2 Tax=Deinococcus sonorensis TaxID=309891 RepID=A0AAU7U847_9DEIO
MNDQARNLELLIQAALDEERSSGQGVLAQQAVEQGRTHEAEGQTPAVQPTLLEQMAVTSLEVIDHLRANTTLRREELELLEQAQADLHRRTAQLTQEGDMLHTNLHQVRLAPKDQWEDANLTVPEVAEALPCHQPHQVLAADRCRLDTATMLCATVDVMSVPLRCGPRHPPPSVPPRPACLAFTMACARSATCNLLKMFEM